MPNYLQPPRPQPAKALANCLKELEANWHGQAPMAALWQAWPQIAGAELAAHCRPLRIQGSVLWIGVEQAHWLLALRYAKHQLLGALRGAGFPLQRLELEQRVQNPLADLASGDSAASWANHPSRVDVHGIAACPRCEIPTPAGEIKRWGCCSLCLRQNEQINI
ncbi:MAG TPA: DUF721 domain-containing protein [Synechococcales bacterium UBA8138]|uniref:DUF721 domain-containing protein n=1 Tax=Synechococcus lacustris TaxID=2116544 RepID=UPI0009D5100C|nr:DUF721 domain-containing protein [Synechococcus lacustris]MCP9794840.1 DUF721 domain-containing protein [Synechococcus lacustris L1F-Slac]OON11476.1 MAG: hypothetical protein BTM30_09500 [Synechococcus lacustris str. Tous]HBU25924.1 DUF721 domain-containing protein [Synechococcales bacterium UBA8138]